MSPTPELFRLHRAIAEAIDDRVTSREVWLRISVVAPRTARLGDAEDLVRLVSQHLAHVDPDDPPEEAVSYASGDVQLTFRVIRREPTVRHDPSLPLVINPYPAVAGYSVP
jgi:hypothetical protein